ncbi:transposase InsO family protein [Pseudacidovorax sp. 1753]|uniref:DDE-type integrase/transposase/recombinase n=1 Tax=Pseudacidovorax sp. 1753 TaxID=3156419 RepID=UPI00339A9755
MTYIRIGEQFCFLAAILDACSRKVVGYAISHEIDTRLALAALAAAVQLRRHLRAAFITATAVRRIPAVLTARHCRRRSCAVR